MHDNDIGNHLEIAGHQGWPWDEEDDGWLPISQEELDDLLKKEEERARRTQAVPTPENAAPEGSR